MNPSETIETTMLGAILLRTLGAIDPESGASYMPAPADFVAILAVWTVLGFASGTRLARGAQAMSIVLLLSMLVLGGAGQRLAAFFQAIAARYGTLPAATPSSPPGQTAPMTNPNLPAPRSRGLPFTGRNTPRGVS